MFVDRYTILPGCERPLGCYLLDVKTGKTIAYRFLDNETVLKTYTGMRTDLEGRVVVVDNIGPFPMPFGG